MNGPYSNAYDANPASVTRQVNGRPAKIDLPANGPGTGVALSGSYDSLRMTAGANDSLIAEAGRRLAEAAPDAKVILFGSHARGEAGAGSDLDLLVIEPKIESRRAEFVRLREALGDLGVPIDLVVLRAEYADKRAQVRGTMVNEAMRNGRVLLGA